MSLRLKTLASIALLFVALLLLSLLLVRRVMIAEIQRYEEQNALKLVSHIRLQLGQEQQALAQRAADWAVWDEIYQFASDRNPQFIAQNFGDAYFTTTGFCLTGIYGTDGELAFSKALDPLQNFVMQLQPATLEQLQQLADSIDLADPHSTKGGLLETEWGMVLVVARNILAGDGSGPSRGSMVLGISLDAEYFSRVPWLEGVTAVLLPLQEWNSDPRQQESLLRAGLGSPRIRPATQAVTVDTLLADVFGEPRLILTLSQPPQLSFNSRQIERLLYLGLFLVTAVFALVMLFLLERTVLTPLATLSNNMLQIGARGDFGQHLPATSLDEFSTLAASVNRMLDDLTVSHRYVVESEQRYIALYQHTPVMLHSIDNQGRLISVSDHWLDKLGYVRDDVIGHRSIEFLTDRSRQYADAVVLPAFYATGECRDVPYQFLRKDGTVLEVLLSAIAERDEQGNFIRSLAVLVDVTERKHAEEQSLRRINEIQAITAAFPDLYFRVDHQGRYLEFLGGDKSELYYPPEQMLGKTHREFLPEPAATLLDSGLRRAVASKKLVSIEYTLSLNGKKAVFEARVLPLQLDQMLIVIRNISNRRRAETLQDVLLRISDAVNSAPNLYSLLKTVQHQLGLLINTGNFYVALYSEETGQYEFPYFVDERDTGFTAQRMPNSLTDYVRRTGKALFATSETMQRLTEAGEVKPLGPSSPSWIGAPLNTRHGTLGVVVVQSYDEANLYTEADLEVLSLVSSDIALAIERKRSQDALAASEERYRSFIEQSSEGIWRFEVTEPIPTDLPEDDLIKLCFERAYLAECNNAMARMYGFQRAQELVGARLEQLLPRDDPNSIEFLRSFIRNDFRIQAAESIELKKDGQRRYFFNNMIGIREDAFLVRGWGMQRDVTERRIAEQALRASEEHLRKVIDLVPHFIFAKDLQGRFILVNQAVAEVYGTTVTELTGKSDADFAASNEEIEHFRADDLAVISSNEPRHIAEEMITDVQGRKRLLQTTKIPFSYDGQPAVLGISLDITERKLAEAALRQSEEQYRRLVELAQEGIVTVDAEEHITFCNQAFEQALGYGHEELLGRTLVELCDEQTRQVLLRGTQQRMLGLRSTYEVGLLGKTGEKKVFIVAASPLLNAEGNYEGALGVLTDVTERKRTEQALAYAQKLESLGVLAGGIAHDFNNLLVGVMGNAGLALRELPASSAIRRYILDIEMASQRAADLTRQMLAYSGRGQLTVQQLDLSETVEEITRLLEAAIPRNVVLKFGLARNLPPIEADPVQVRQVTMNLILNAAEAIGESSGIVSVVTGAVDADRVYLSSSYLHEELAEGLYVFMEVSDTGCGMDAETRGKIFDPFFTTKFTGRGLGLAAVLGIVRAHRGSIKVYSELNSGSTFKVLFPACPEPLAVQPHAAQFEARWLGSGTVLVVDDEPTVRAVAKRVLEQHGFTVLTAADGEEGLELYRQLGAEIALVLLDMTMPRLSGEEAFREMRRLNPDVRVLLSSGYNEVDATTRFSGKGLAGFLQKPYSPAELIAKIRESLDFENPQLTADESGESG